MATRTNQEQLQRFDEIVEHFAVKPSRRTDVSASGLDRNICEADGRICASSMFGTREEAILIQGYITGARVGAKKLPGWLVYDEKAAMAAGKKHSDEWGVCLTFLVAAIHDDDRCWDYEGLTEFGHGMVNAIRHLLVMNCIPSDGQFKKDCREIMRSKNMFDALLAYILEIGATHPMSN